MPITSTCLKNVPSPQTGMALYQGIRIGILTPNGTHRGAADGLAEIALVDRLRVRKVLPELGADAKSPAVHARSN